MRQLAVQHNMGLKLGWDLSVSLFSLWVCGILFFFYIQNTMHVGVIGDLEQTLKWKFLRPWSSMIDR